MGKITFWNLEMLCNNSGKRAKGLVMGNILECKKF